MANGIPSDPGDTAPMPGDPGDQSIFSGAYHHLENLLERVMTNDYTREWDYRATWDIEPSDSQYGKYFGWEPSLLGEESFHPNHISWMDPDLWGIEGIHVNVSLATGRRRFIAPEDTEWATGVYPDLAELLEIHHIGHHLAASGNRIFRPWYSVHFVPESPSFMFHWTRMHCDPHTLLPTLEESEAEIIHNVPQVVEVMEKVGRPPIYPSTAHIAQLIEAIDAMEWVVDPYG